MGDLSYLTQQVQANHVSCCMLGWHAHMHRSPAALLNMMPGQALGRKCSSHLSTCAKAGIHTHLGGI
jgi:hypothetical protein